MEGRDWAECSVLPPEDNVWDSECPALVTMSHPTAQSVWRGWQQLAVRPSTERLAGSLSLL